MMLQALLRGHTCDAGPACWATTGWLYVCCRCGVLLSPHTAQVSAVRRNSNYY
jgi:hypothetical protein